MCLGDARHKRLPRDRMAPWHLTETFYIEYENQRQCLPYGPIHICVCICIYRESVHHGTTMRPMKLDFAITIHTTKWNPNSSHHARNRLSGWFCKNGHHLHPFLAQQRHMKCMLCFWCSLQYNTNRRGLMYPGWVWQSHFPQWTFRICTIIYTYKQRNRLTSMYLIQTSCLWWFSMGGLPWVSWKQ